MLIALRRMPEYKTECHVTLLKNEKVRRDKDRKIQEEKEKERRISKSNPSGTNGGGTGGSAPNSSSKRRFGEAFEYSQAPPISYTMKQLLSQHSSEQARTTLWRALPSTAPAAR